MSKISYVYCDANVFLAYINAEKDHITTLETFFDEIQTDKNRKIATSILSITEVAHASEEKTRHRISTQILDAIDALWGDTSLIEFIDFNELLARQARNLIRQAIEPSFVLKSHDAIHLVSARYVGISDFFTYDKKLYKFNVMMGFNIGEPFANNPQLPLNFDKDKDDSIS